MCIRDRFNIVFISAVAMLLTCITASLAGYALAKKRFIGRTVLFTIIICAMALPKHCLLYTSKGKRGKENTAGHSPS